MNERRPEQIIPTEPPPPPPGRAPDQTIPDDGPPDMPPPSKPSRSPEHAPSQRTAGGRVQLKRTATPPDRAAVIIDRAKSQPARAREVERLGLCFSHASTLLTR